MATRTDPAATVAATDNPASRKRIILVIWAVFALSACSDPQGAKEAAEAQGFTQVQPGGHPFWGCGQDDTYATEFSARGVNGRCVTGVVCSSWLKGATVRITSTQICSGAAP